MTIKHKHINTNGDTEYTVEHRPSLQWTIVNKVDRRREKNQKSSSN